MHLDSGKWDPETKGGRVRHLKGTGQLPVTFSICTTFQAFSFIIIYISALSTTTHSTITNLHPSYGESTLHVYSSAIDPPFYVMAAITPAFAPADDEPAASLNLSSSATPLMTISSSCA